MERRFEAGVMVVIHTKNGRRLYIEQRSNYICGEGDFFKGLETFPNKVVGKLSA